MNKRVKKLTSVLLAAAMMLTALSPKPVNVQAAEAANAKTVPEGFAYANGTSFMCDGSPYYYAGTNCYYLIYKSKEAVDNVMNDASAMGLNVIRTWGHLDCGVITDQKNENGTPVFQNNVEGSGEKDGVYFQYFDPAVNKPVVNEGKDGLERLDYVIATAEEHDIKLILTFTNYWDAFGGMKQYAYWAKEAGLGSNLTVEDFYTNDILKTWYKDYINTLLNHTNVYTGRKLKDEPAVFAWELANEPRCGKTDQGCQNNTVYNWAKEMSEYVKSIDPNHMVSIGDEGFYNLPYGSVKDSTCSYVWYGAEGTDFEKNMSIDTIDFGTPHMYVDQWGLNITGGTDDLIWIKKHAETAKEYNKPVVLEEFGLTDKSLRETKYRQWYDIIEGKTYEGLAYAGSNYWMIASYIEGNTLYDDYDNYTVYGPAEVTATAATRALIMEHAAVMKQKNIANSVTPAASDFDRSNPKDVSFQAAMKIGQIAGLACEDEELVQGEAYTINGMNITIKSDYLKDKEIAEYTFKLLTTDGNKPTFTVKVCDSAIKNPELSVYSVEVDKNPKECQDITVTMQKNGSNLLGLLYKKAALNENTDYTVSGDTVTIHKSFLASLPEGRQAVVFDFFEGMDCELVFNVTDSTGKDSFDTFDSYTSDAELNAAYSRNTGGNEVGLSLSSKNQSQALKFDYNVGNPDYCGVNKKLSRNDYSAYQGIELWIEGDGSGNEVTIQIMDANSNYWESYIMLDFTGGKTVKLPFDKFVEASWQHNEEALKTDAINQLSIYVGRKGNDTAGTIYFDNMNAYKGGSIVVEEPYVVEDSKTYDVKNPAEIVTTAVLYGNYITSVTCNQTTLTDGSDYTINGGQIRLNKTFLETLTTDDTYCITYSFSNGGSDTMQLVVTGNTTEPEAIPVTGIKLGKQTLSLAEGESTRLEAVVAPDNASDKAVTWKSSDEAVAAVNDQGTVTAKKAGTATVTVTTRDGAYEAECTVTVSSKAVSGEIYYREWISTVAYEPGAIVYYNGKYYQAQWDNTNDTPGAGGAWNEYEVTEANRPDKPYQKPQAGVYPDWDADMVYTGGEIVYYEGEYFICRWWSSNQKPDITDAYGCWKLYI